MQEMEYNIRLLNYMKGKNEKGEPYYRIGYIFEDYVENDNFCGLHEENLYIKKDPFKVFDGSKILRKFVLRGELISDYKNPLNQRFVPKTLLDVKDNYEISISVEKQK